MEGWVNLISKEKECGRIAQFNVSALWLMNMYRKRNSRAPVDRLETEKNTA